jgi:hypothetical protein
MMTTLSIGFILVPVIAITVFCVTATVAVIQAMKAFKQK